MELEKLMVEHDVCSPDSDLTYQIPTEYEVFSGYLLHKAAGRDYDLREKVADQVDLQISFSNEIVQSCQSICNCGPL